MELISMEQQVQNVLQVSARLYEHLGNIPKGEKRDTYIEKINELLDERSILIEELRNSGFVMDDTKEYHIILVELDKGIRNRLNNVMVEIKHDMKDLQNAKKNEKQYMNPYSNVRVMDGMYYDRKK